MSNLLAPVLFALFLWWFSTGAILFLDGLPRRTFRWSMAGATLLAALAVYGLWMTTADTSVAGAYLAFSCGLMIWAWHEMSFLMGIVTGTRKDAPPEGARGWQRFVAAAQTLIHHELAILATAVLVIALTWDQPNQVALWTFLVLWGMKTSAKFNVFLGARNLSVEFLPDHLKYLQHHFRYRNMNGLFPVTMIVSVLVSAVLLQQAFDDATTPFASTGHLLVVTLLGLAIVEHVFLFMPFPADALWRWGLRSRTVEGSETSETPGKAAADAQRTNLSGEAIVPRPQTAPRPV